MSVVVMEESKILYRYWAAYYMLTIFCLSVMSSIEALEDNITAELPEGNTTGSDNRSLNLTVQFHPKILSEIQDLSDEERHTVNFTCEAVGEPVPSISWSFNDKLINDSIKYMIISRSLSITTTESTLTVYNAINSDEGIYSCTASNILGNDTSYGCLSGVEHQFCGWDISCDDFSTVSSCDDTDCTSDCFCTDRVELEDGVCIQPDSCPIPTSILTPVNNITTIVTNESNTTEVMCKAIGFPPPTVAWNKINGFSSRELVSAGVFSGNGMVIANLTITKREDTGMYTCSAKNSIGIDERNITIIVQYHPVILSEITDLSYEGRDVVNFTCKAMGEPVPVIRWCFNGAMINIPDNSSKYMIMSRSSNVTTTENTLTVYNVTSPDAGTYTCNSSNIIGSVTSSGILTVTSIATINTFAVNKTIVLERNTITVTCEALGYPPPNIMWHRLDGNFSDRVSVSDSVSVPTGYGNVTRVSVNLTITNASRVDRGNYTCSAENNIGVDSENIIITVQFAPEIILQVNDLLINETNSANFVCQATGVPIPSVKWYFNGEMINPPNILKYNYLRMVLNESVIESALNIIDVELSDVGTYTCEAENIIDKDQSSGILTLNANVNVTTQHASITIFQGDNVTLSCMPSKPDVALQWSYNNSEVGSSSNHHFTPPLLNHNLTITNANDTDSGNYVCSFTFQNSLIDEKTIYLTVVPTCLQNFSGGLLWPTSRRNSEATQRCSNLHPNFRSGVFISRKCNTDGTWGPVNDSSCTAQDNAIPTLILSFTVNVSQSNPETITHNIIQWIMSSSNFSGYNLSNESISYEPQQAGILIRFMSNSFTENLNLSQIVPDDVTINSLLYSKEIMLYIPGLKCECSLRKKPMRTICIGPSTPPCDCSQESCKCNPPFVGNDGICGLDTDSDGCPDEDLGCSQSNCKSDLCVNNYSSNCTSDDSICNPQPSPSPDPFMCLREVDKVWNITWPTTSSGQMVRQKCPGGAESIGLASRLCDGEPAAWQDPNVENCSTVEIIRINEEVQNLRSVFESVQSDNSSDRTVMVEPEVLQDITGELASVTDNDAVILPNDLNDTVNIVETILSFAQSDLGLATEETLVNIINICDNIFNPENEPAYAALDANQEDSESVGAQALQNVEILSDLISSTLEAGSNKSVNFSRSERFISIEAQLLSQEDMEAGVDINFPLVMNANISAQSTIPNSVIQKYPGPVSQAFLSNSFLPSTFDGPGQFNQSFPILVIQINASGRVDLPENGAISMRYNISETLINNTSPVRCVFWQSERNSWSDDGVSTNRTNDRVECITTHLTSFSVLVDTRGTSPSHGSALSIISYIGCGVSIIALLLTMFAIVYWSEKSDEFDDWKSIYTGTHNFIHFNLSLSLLIGLIIFVSAVETVKEQEVACRAVAALLHYFFLAAFVWMLCEGIFLYIYLNFLFYHGFFKKWYFYFALGWGIPIPVVAIAAGIAHDQYGSDRGCWLSEVNGTIWAFVAPMLLIILINSIFLIISLRLIFKNKKEKLQISDAESHRTEITKTVIISAGALMPLLGVTWVIGLLAVNNHTLVFAWIFTILNSLQGFFIFFFYVVKQEQVRRKVNAGTYLHRFGNALLLTLPWKNASTTLTTDAIKVESDPDTLRQGKGLTGTLETNLQSIDSKDDASSSVLAPNKSKPSRSASSKDKDFLDVANKSAYETSFVDSQCQDGNCDDSSDDSVHDSALDDLEPENTPL